LTDRIKEEMEKMRGLIEEAKGLDSTRPATYAIYVTWHWIHPRGYHTMYRTDGRPVIYITKAVWEAVKVRMYARKTPSGFTVHTHGMLTGYAGFPVYELEDAHEALKRRG
jgi:hypothetical protein